MYRSIMLPLDGSLFSEQALPIANRIAGRCAAELQIVHVHQPQMDADWDPVTPYRFEGVVQAEHEWDHEAARLEAEYISRHVGVQCRVLEGDVVPTLEDEIKSSSPDLIVMATHGRGGLSRAWLGSVADTLIRDLHKPILLIRARAEAEAAPVFAMENVLVPLDGSPVAESIIEHALTITEPAAARITLLRVVVPAFVAAELHGFARTEAAQRERVDEAQDYLHGVTRRLRAAGYTVNADVVVSHTARARSWSMRSRTGST